MIAVQRSWGEDGFWNTYDETLKEGRTWECFSEDFNKEWHQPLSIRYDNGQLCTFRSKSRPGRAR